MEYWKEERVDRGHGIEGIVLPDDDGETNVFSVSKEDEFFFFTEERDAWGTAHFTKEQALQMIDELREWILKQ